MNPLSKMFVPWMLLGFMVVIFISGVIGMFIGFNVAENSFQEQRIHMIAVQNQALAERDKRRIEAEQRNTQLETQFLAQIQGLSDNYKTLSRQLADELKDDIYTRCQLPARGREILNRSVTDANKRK
ncbi:hypothetical protein D7B12_17765 [Salmonella enterica]|nr:hypothetical protein [Salmonella enterica]